MNTFLLMVTLSLLVTLPLLIVVLSLSAQISNADYNCLEDTCGIMQGVEHYNPAEIILNAPIAFLFVFGAVAIIETVIIALIYLWTRKS